MSLLEVRNVKKVYTTRLGANQVQALSNVNFSVEDGEYVTIMGESGSGKTTLLNILAALDRPTAGEILLNGKNTVEIKNKELSAFRRTNLGFVFQDFNLLDTFSLKDNIFLPLVLSGEQYPQMMQKLEPIAKKLEITHLLEKYPYEVSGGQKQRLLIARALAGKPNILILDDSSSALDYQTDAALRNAIRREYPDFTVILVAQRVSSVRNADQILVLDEGRVAGLGFHEELMETCSLYQQIAKIQTGGEE